MNSSGCSESAILGMGGERTHGFQSSLGRISRHLIQKRAINIRWDSSSAPVETDVRRAKVYTLFNKALFLTPNNPATQKL